ncbi:hypothetical protein BDP27DRAFT_632767 [Rhodocollybia butyracea]|uniref:Uncharacterized protein n=1 Tax=Rhodocollybia butyracea TaxID=206335 RepID=A0A9P5U8V4_9AGAR|nr:hypothetical protein BDP27DRAFT_632767 [Rhodocollybia butyracea]
MTLASAPFVWDYLASRGDVSAVRAFPELSVGSSRLFQAYLFAELSVGARLAQYIIGINKHCDLVAPPSLISKRYRVQCDSPEMGVGLFFGHLYGVPDLLRLVLGFSTLFFSLPPLQMSSSPSPLSRGFSSIMSSASHLSIPLPSSPEIGSIVPTVFLMRIFPTHATWFVGCLKGFKKRQRDEGENRDKRPEKNHKEI